MASTAPTVALRARRLERGVLAAAAALAAWTATTVAVWLGELRVPGIAKALLFGAVPLGLAATALLSRRDSAALKLLAGGTCVVAGAIVAAPMASFGALVALPPLAVAGALLVRRFTTVALVAVLVCTGAYGSLTAFTPVPAAAIVAGVLACMLVAWVLDLRFGRRDRQAVVWPAVVLLALYAAVTWSGLFFSPSREGATDEVRTWGLFLTAAIAIPYGPWREHVPERVARGLVAVAAGVGAYATYRWIVGPAEAEQELITFTETNTVGGEEKVQGSFPSGAELGQWTAVVIPFLLAGVLAARSWVRPVAAAAAVLCLVGLLASELRMGLVGAGAGCVVVAAAFQLSRGFRGPRLGVLLVVAAGAVVAGLVAFPAVVGDNPDSLERYRNILTPAQDPSVADRLWKWEQAIADIDDHPFGRGLATAGPLSYEHQPTLENASGFIDNNYLGLAFQQGLGAMVLYVAAIAGLLVGLLRRAVWSRERAGVWMALGAAGALVSWSLVFVTQMLHTTYAATLVFVIAGLGIAPFAWRQRPAATASRYTASSRETIDSTVKPAS